MIRAMLLSSDTFDSDLSKAIETGQDGDMIVLSAGKSLYKQNMLSSVQLAIRESEKDFIIIITYRESICDMYGVTFQPLIEGEWVELQGKEK